jgi:hypothetical protein
MIINSQVSGRNEGRISEKERVDNIVRIHTNKSTRFNQFYFFIILLKVDDRICGKKRPYHLGHTGYQCSFRLFHKRHVKKKTFAIPVFTYSNYLRSCHHPMLQKI